MVSSHHAISNLIHDRDSLFSTSFRATLSPAGVETVKLPARSPNLNAHAERFIRSIKHESLNETSTFANARSASWVVETTWL